MNWKEFIVDSVTALLFWGTIWFVVFLFYRVSITIALKMCITGAILNIVFGGIFGKTLNKVRRIFKCHT